jgi:hypothetical protein
MEETETDPLEILKKFTERMENMKTEWGEKRFKKAYEKALEAQQQPVKIKEDSQEE